MRLLRRKKHMEPATESHAPKAVSPGPEAMGGVESTLLFQVEALYVERANTSSCEALVTALSQADRVRSAQGHVAFMFPDYEDAEFLYAVPEVRRFVRTLHERVEHLFYFLSVDPALAQFLEFTAAFAADEHLVRIGGQMTVEYSDEVMNEFFARLVAVWRFADQVGHDAERVVRSIAEQGAFPPELVNGLIAEVARQA
jgi:hypothetical protein